jgi:hypothetical protein
LAGHFPIYFPANFGREPLFMYSVAGLFGLTGGHTVWSLRFTSVLWGMLGLAVTLVYARRLLSEGAALVAAALMATSFWFLMAARLGLEPIALLSLAAAFLYFLDRGLARESLPSFVVAGLVGGLAVYTYLAARALFLLIPLLLIYEGIVWICLRRSASGRLQQANTRPLESSLQAVGDSGGNNRLKPPVRSKRWLSSGQETRRLAGLLATLAVMLAVCAPLLVYLTGHSATADGRVRELGDAIVSAGRGDLKPILATAFDTFRSILWAGSQALPYHYNIPGRPVLQPILAIFFMIGLIAAVARLRERREYLLLAALLLGLAPSLLTGADALYMRGIIALSLLFILAARGMWVAGSLAGRLLSRFRLEASAALPALVAVLLAGLLVWHAADSAAAYFVRWAGAEQTQRIYNADFRAAARYLEENPADAGREVFIGTDRLLDLDSRTYLLYEPPCTDVSWFFLPESPALPREGAALYLMPANAETPPSLQLVAEAGVEQFVLPGPGGLYELLRGFWVDADAVAHALDASGVRPADEPVSFGDALRLDGLGHREDDSQSRLVTQWTVLAPWPRTARPGYLLPRPKLAFSLVDDAGYKWAQADVATSLPVLTWRPGQRLVEEIPFSIPADLPPGGYGVQLVLYDDEGGPLPMRTADGREAATPPVIGRLQISSRPRGDPPVPPFSVEQTQAGNDLAPVGSWESPDRLVDGVPADLHVSWQALRALDTRDLRFRLRATAADGSPLWEQPADPLAPLPSSWSSRQTYRLTHRLQPAVSGSGAVSVTLELCAEQANAPLACAVVGRPTVVSRNAAFELPAAPEQTPNARFDESLTLAGVDVARDGQAVTLTLYWRTDAAPTAPWKRFVHAVGADGEIVAQSDVFLESDGVSASYWRPGEYVVDRAVLETPAGAGVGELYVGLYDPQTGERLPVTAPSGEPLPERRFTIALQPASPEQM